MCLSDSGAWQLQGVLSHHGGCRGGSARPAVFTGIHVVRDWIRHTVGKKLRISNKDVSFTLSIVSGSTFD